jgi:hypothetical protein
MSAALSAALLNKLISQKNADKFKNCERHTRTTQAFRADHNSIWGQRHDKLHRWLTDGWDAQKQNSL